MVGQGMRMALKGSTPSAHARLKYITREGRYAQGIEGPRTDLAASGSGNLPTWSAGDADHFWHGVDQFERANARRCVELELNLPPELTLAEQKQTVERYAERLLGAERMPYTWAIHNDGGGKNPHVHLMFQERGLDGIDRPNAQAWFKRANPKDASKGGARKSRSITGTAWTMHARVTWAQAVNDGLKAAGHEPRFDPRSKLVQRDEALRNGDLRRAAALGTLTERHEGATIAGIRRRIERDEREEDERYEREEDERYELPDHALQLIRTNDAARAYNNALRDWVRTACDADLKDYLADDLAELQVQLDVENPSAHVAAFELNELIQLEVADHAALLLVIMFEEAHGAALLEYAHREALVENALYDIQRSQLLIEIVALLESLQACPGGGLTEVTRQRARGLHEYYALGGDGDSLAQLIPVRDAMRLRVFKNIYNEALEINALYDLHEVALTEDTQRAHSEARAEDVSRTEHRIRQNMKALDQHIEKRARWENVVVDQFRPFQQAKAAFETAQKKASGLVGGFFYKRELVAAQAILDQAHQLFRQRKAEAIEQLAEFRERRQALEQQLELNGLQLDGGEALRQSIRGQLEHISQISSLIEPPAVYQRRTDLADLAVSIEKADLSMLLRLRGELLTLSNQTVAHARDWLQKSCDNSRHRCLIYSTAIDQGRLNGVQGIDQVRAELSELEGEARRLRPAAQEKMTLEEAARATLGATQLEQVLADFEGLRQLLNEKENQRLEADYRNGHDPSGMSF